MPLRKKIVYECPVRGIVFHKKDIPNPLELSETVCKGCYFQGEVDVKRGFVLKTFCTCPLDLEMSPEKYRELVFAYHEAIGEGNRNKEGFLEFISEEND